MPENFAIVGEKETYISGKPNKIFVLGKRQPRHGASNGEIDLYPVGEVKSGIAVALLEDQTGQASNLRDLKKSSSPLGYLVTSHSLTKGTLRIISKEELDTILAASQNSEEISGDTRFWDNSGTGSIKQSSRWWEQC